MKQLRVKIKNLGRISEADIRLGGFTVLVGRNSTGKSYASKAIYSLLQAIDQIVPIGYRVGRLRDRLLRLVRLIEGKQNEGKQNELQFHEKEQFVDLSKQVKELFYFDNITDKPASFFTKHFRQKKESIDLLRKNLEDALKIGPVQEDSEEEKIRMHLSFAINDLEILLRLSSISQSRMSRNMADNLQSNFQTAHQNDIFRDKDKPVTIELEGVALFELWDKISVKVDSVDNLEEFSLSLSTLFFIESPVHLKLKSALDAVSRNLNRRRFREDIGKKSLVPGYYVDLHDNLAETLVVDENQEKFEKISNDISQAIGGNLRINKNDDIVFRSSEDGREHSMPLSATGIANFGMLGLLLKNRLLGKGSYLFIDEPEAHLHPEWVVQMANSLLALVENGVNVIVATHSSVFLKWIEVITAENPDLRKKFAFNHFVNGQVVQNEDLNVETNFETKFKNELNDIQQDISEPYGHLYMRGLGL